MIFGILFAVLTGVGLLVSAVSLPVLNPAMAAAYAGFTVLILLAGRARHGALDALARHWAPALVFLALIGWLYWRATHITSPHAVNPAALERHLILLAGVAFAAFAAAAAARGYGRLEFTTALLLMGLVVGLSDIGMIAIGLAPAEAGVALAGIMTLAAFTAIDSFGRPVDPGMSSRSSALARRLFAPTSAFICAVGSIAARQDWAAVAAGVGGILAIGAVMTLRARAGRRATPVFSSLALTGVAIGLAGLVAAGRFATGLAESSGGLVSPTQAAWAIWNEALAFGVSLGALDQYAAVDGAPSGWVWAAETGFVGILAAAAIALALIVSQGLTRDRGRRPSRGTALAVGITACAALGSYYSDDLSALAQAGTLAAIGGLAAAFGDTRSVKRSDPAGTLRL